METIFHPECKNKLIYLQTDKGAAGTGSQPSIPYTLTLCILHRSGWFSCHLKFIINFNSIYMIYLYLNSYALLINIGTWSN